MLTPDLIRTLLPALLGLPIAAALILRFVGGGQARSVALVFALAHLGLTTAIVFSGMFAVQEGPDVARGTIGRQQRYEESVFAPHFVPGDPMTGGRETHSTNLDVLPFAAVGGTAGKVRAAQFFIGLDGLNIWLVALASFMLVPVILVSWDGGADRPGPFFSWLFLLQAGVLGVFLSFDLLLFYVCFELTLVPLLFLIGAWGPGPNRRDAARKLFLFTLAGGLITLIGLAGTVLFVFDRTGELTFSIPRLADLIHANAQTAGAAGRSLWVDPQTYLFLAMAVGFAVKIPLVPFHSWLPGAYSEAPLGVTVMLSALLAKMGTFGFLRVCLPLAPDATLAVGMPLVGVLASIGIVYGAFCAYAQTDFRRLVAYSSVSHLGFCVLALVAFNPFGIAGGLLHMVNHGLSTGALFILVGLLARRYGSSQIADYSGMWTRLPVLTFFTMVICLASVGLPGLNNFVSEIIMLGGLFNLRSTAGNTFAFVAGAGIFLSAWYTMTMVRRVYFGPVKEPHGVAGVKDLTSIERMAVGPLAVLCLLLGLFPQPVLSVMERDVTRLSQVADEARGRAK